MLPYFNALHLQCNRSSPPERVVVTLDDSGDNRELEDGEIRELAMASRAPSGMRRAPLQQVFCAFLAFLCVHFIVI